MEEQLSYFGSHLNVNELAGVFLNVPQFGDPNLNVVISDRPPAELVVEKPVSALDKVASYKEVVVPNLKGTSAKSFARVLSNTCVIPQCQFPKFSLKGDDISINIPEDEYKVNVESRRNHLHGRLILSKGDPPLKLEDLRAKLNTLWKPLSKWGIVSLGRGFYEFVFSSIEDVKTFKGTALFQTK